MEIFKAYVCVFLSVKLYINRGNLILLFTYFNKDDAYESQL